MAEAAVINTLAVRIEGTEPLFYLSPCATGSCLTPSQFSFMACALRTLPCAWCLSSWRTAACLTISGAKGAAFQRKPCWGCAKMCVKEWLIWNKTLSSTETWYVGPTQTFSLPQMGFILHFLPSFASAFTFLLPIYGQGTQYLSLLPPMLSEQQVRIFPGALLLCFS